ncbi:hypothetical protein GYMLUDRAFT_157593 [Collybiopsis luxurians FD-317 M1]|nr:hypothetical protein GYMLUDRAFT_157593 [Collybiopsis luxurians FD-317 M1]
MYEELKNAEYEELSLAISLANSPQIPQTSPAHKSSSYEKVYERLQAEWTSIGTWLIGLAALVFSCLNLITCLQCALCSVNIAIFAIPPLSSDIATTPHTLSCITLSSSLFPINVCVRSVAGVSAATTALGLIWDVYFWVSYCGRDVETFLVSSH